MGKTLVLAGTGFVVAPTHRPCTKGLWMWSSPVERHSADGSKYHLVSCLNTPHSALYGIGYRALSHAYATGAVGHRGNRCIRPGVGSLTAGRFVSTASRIHRRTYADFVL